MKTKRLQPKKVKRLRVKTHPYSSDKEIRRKAFFELKRKLPHVTLPLDGLLCAASGCFYLDVLQLERRIPNYNGETCEYKGIKKYSMKAAITEEWGEEVVKLIEILL